MERFSILGMGWQRSIPDFRDFSPSSPEIQELLMTLEQAQDEPSFIDLREYFPEPQDQRKLNSSAVHALLSLVEYFERRANGMNTEPSRMFLYYVARKLARLTGDSGVDLRSTIKAMIRFGVPPEIYWAYESELLDVAPEAFLYSYNTNLPLPHYVRLDVGNQSGSQTLQSVKSFLAAGFPVVFGFPVPCSVSSNEDIPFRPTIDSVIGGQAVVAIGYDDRRPGDHRGALLIRNSWGKRWGENGYGWLPYAFVHNQLAGDFWTLIAPQWLASGEFAMPKVVAHHSQSASTIL